MNERKQYYISTPIYYVNDQPHIGHVYTTTIADVSARFQRLRGRDVFFLTGTDEHATKVVEAAAARGISAQEWADRNAAAFEQTFARLGMSHNDFIRTTQPRHKTRVQQYVQALRDGGDIYLGEYEGWYDAGQEEYVTDGNAKEYEYKSPINGKPLIRRTEKNYFFRLSQYAQPLLDWMEANPRCVQPEARKNEVIARIRAGLNDVPISRTGAEGWGIAVPGDEAHSIYVWIDALCNYLTTVDTDDRRTFWPADVHLIAKDILWFHAVIWPALLMALAKRPGYEWVKLPGQVYSHSFWISEGQKMSKSLGNFIDLAKLDHYVATFGLDALRWFLATQGPLGTTDSDFAESKFIEVYNRDLANTLGNSFSRVSNMTAKYFDGQLPAPSQTDSKPVRGELTPWPQIASGAVRQFAQSAGDLQFGAAGAAALGLVQQVDDYIEQRAPFKLAKDPAKLGEVATILYHCAEALRVASVLLWPFVPQASASIWERLGLDYAQQIQQAGGRGQFDAWTQWGLLKPGAVVEKGEALFPRYQPAK